MPEAIIMSANQQFILALLGLFIAPTAALVSLWFTRKTHQQVNSRMDEYKAVLAAASKETVDSAVIEMRRLLALEAAVKVSSKEAKVLIVEPVPTAPSKLADGTTT